MESLPLALVGVSLNVLPLECIRIQGNAAKEIGPGVVWAVEHLDVSCGAPRQSPNVAGPFGGSGVKDQGFIVEVAVLI